MLYHDMQTMMFYLQYLAQVYKKGVLSRVAVSQMPEMAVVKFNQVISFWFTHHFVQAGEENQDIFIVQQQIAENLHVSKQKSNPGPVS